MAGCKRCALKGEKSEREKRSEKKKKKEEKMGISVVFLLLFFYVRAHVVFFFICAAVIFQIYKENCISAIVCDQIFNGESMWRLVRAKYAPHPYFGNFFQISLAVLRIYEISSL